VLAIAANTSKGPNVVVVVVNPIIELELNLVEFNFHSMYLNSIQT
jgi:hypothetical protein